MNALRSLISTCIALGLTVGPQLVFAAGGGGGHGGGFQFHWGNWLIQVVNFAIFLGFLLWWVGPMAKEYFQSKREELLEELEEAKRMREEAEARVEEYNAKLEAFESKRQELLEEYHEQGEREKERLIEEAKEQVEKMREDARRTIEQEKKKAIANIEEDAVEMAVEIARKQARDELDQSTHHTLIESFVSNLAEEDDSSQQRV